MYIVFVFIILQLAINFTTAGEYDMSSEWGKVVNAVIHFALITKGLFDIRYVHVCTIMFDLFITI